VNEPQQCHILTRVDLRCDRDAIRVLGDTLMCDKHFKQIYEDAVELETSRLNRFDETIQDRAVQEVLESLKAELEALRHRSLRPRASVDNSVVYYGEVGGGLIKIGTTTNLYQRERTLYMRTLAFEAGGPQEEAMRHRQFAEERLTKDGELFHRSERLMAWIDEVRRLGQQSGNEA
jgi:hypothetical protein